MSSRKKRRKKSKSSRHGVSAVQSVKKDLRNEPGRPSPENPPRTTPSDPVDEIRRLISGGKIKAAVSKAKLYHKSLGTDESEMILVDAYAARIREMIAKDYIVEAKALLELIRERYHCPDYYITQFGGLIAIREGRIDELVRPLNDPGLPPEIRSTCENIIKNELVDLNLLVRSEAISSGHPLKTGARAVVEAFAKVTSGSIQPKEIALPAISRRSPLAPWKMLIKAIFFFYQHDDEKCEKYLNSVDSESAPGRIVPLMLEMIAGIEHGSHGKDSTFLVEKVTGNSRGVGDALRTLDKALIANKPSRIFKATRNAVQICAQSSPGLVEKLKQHIAVRSWMLDLDAEAVGRAMGGPSLKNAYFWQLHARAMEMKNNAFWACAMWEEFRKHALHEGWFPENSAEESAVYLYMADLLKQLPEEDFDWLQYEFKSEFKGFEFYYRNQPQFIREAVRKNTAGRSDPYFLHPENLYRLASKINPTAETYRQWLKSVETRNSHWKQGDAVALDWHAAFPEDSRPLLYLMQSAEQRNAFKKALGYLDTAERIDGLNPDVKRARLRLLAATAVRHLKQKKTHLAQKDIAAIEGLPQAREGHRPAFVAALKSVCAAIDQNESDLNRWNRELEALLEYPLAAKVVFQGLLTECRFSDRQMNLPEFVGGPLDGNDLVAALARGCQLGEDMRIAVAIPREYEKKLRDIFTADGLSHDNTAIRAIAETALKNKNLKLAYAAAGAGLLQGGAATARFLLLRARSLPPWEMERKDECLVAAIELARRERDMDLLDEAIELRRSKNGLPFGFSFFGFMLGDDNSSMETEELNEVLAREKKVRDYPSEIRDDYFFDFDDDDFDDDDIDVDDHKSQCRYCDVRNCPDREAPYSPHKLHDDGFDDEFDDMDNPPDFNDVLDDIRGDLPPELWSLINKVFRKHGRNGSFPAPDEVKLKDPWLADQLLRDMRKAEVEGTLRVFDRDWLRSWRPRNSRRKRR